MKKVTIVSDHCSTQISVYLQTKLHELYAEGWTIAHFIVTPSKGDNSLYLHTIVLEKEA